MRIQSSILQPSGPICPACNNELGEASLQTQLEVQIRAYIGRYYEGWTICDDATCGHRTRSMGVYGRRCVRPGCRGTVQFEYSDVELYNQLRYFAMLFDPEKAQKAATGSAHFGMRSPFLVSFQAETWFDSRNASRRSLRSYSDQADVFAGDERHGRQIH